MEYIFLAKVKKGKLIIEDEETFNKFLKDKEGLYNLTLTRTRTDKQNRLYHFYLNIIHEETGQGLEDLKELFRDRFISGRPTEELTTKEFSKYIDDIRQLMAEMNIPLPDPPADDPQ